MSNVNFTYTNLTPFKWYVLENFPFIEADFDALTNWQLFCKLGKEINKIILAVNKVGQQTEDLTTFVTNYFNNLDVQEEINNKLDEMAQDGTLEEIIANYINLKSVLTFDTVNDMKMATNLIDGSVCRTLGFYTLNDNGGALYKIKTVNNQDNVDNCFIIPLQNETLVAELIYTKILNIDCLGAKDYNTDNSFDNTQIIQKAIDKFTENNGNGGTILFSPKTYKVNSTIIVKPFMKLKGESLSTTGNTRGSVIYATIPKDSDLFKMPTVSSQNGNGYISMEDLSLYGNGNGIGLNLDTVMHSHFRNLNILYFQTGLKINGGMLNTFENLNIRFFYEFGILLDNGSVNTREFFNNCYIGQTNFDNRDSAIPIYVCRKAVIDAIFTNCTVESTRQGIFITPENHIEFNGLYTENAPAVARPLFNIGILSDDSAFASSTTKDNSVAPAVLGSAGQVIINGSFFQGSTSVANNTANKNFLHPGYVDLISVSNSKIRAFNYMWDNVTNVRSKISFSNCEANTFGSRAFAVSDKLEYFNCRYTDTQSNYDSFNNVMPLSNSSANVSAVNWYRVAKIEGTNADANIISVHTNYSTSKPVSFLLGITTSSNTANINLLSACVSTDNTIDQVRIVSDGTDRYIEVHYNKSTSNTLSCRVVSTGGSATSINPTPTTGTPTVIKTLDILNT